MNFKLLLLVSIVFFSCKHKTEKFTYNSTIAVKVYQAQMKYLDNTLVNYSRISKKGNYYFQESFHLDQAIHELQDELRNGGAISAKRLAVFYRHIEQSFTGYKLVDGDILEQLKDLPINTVSDLDFLRFYVKNYYVGILLNNKLLPYDTWSTMACVFNATINDGEVFEVELANTAWSNSQPNEWFLVKVNTDSLTKDNIIDTLQQDETGIVNFKTFDYKKGENTLIFVSKLNSPVEDDRMVSKQVTFYVK